VTIFLLLDPDTMSVLILGLDMGTTSISAVAVDEQGRIVRSVTRTHHAAVDGLPAEYAEQDPALILTAAMEALTELVQQCDPNQFLGLALTGQMHSTVLLNADRHVIGNVITWQDRRSLAAGPNGTLLAELQRRASDSEMLNTGCRFSAGYLGTTLSALRQLGQLSPDVASVSFVADWIGSCLTHKSPVTDRSHAASSGLFDLKADDWNEALLQAAEIQRAWLPTVVDSGAVIGRLHSEIAEQLKLPSGLPVFNAIGDNQASVLSALPDFPGSVLINIGTGGQIVWRIPEFARQLPLDTRVLPGNPDRRSGRSVPQFMIVGAGLCGGDAIAWVNRTIRRWLADFGVTLTDEDIWKRLSEQVNPQSNSAELVCEPFFRGTRYEPERRGVFRGVGTDNFTPANLLVSVLDGIAQSMFDVWKSSPTSDEISLKQIVMAGNAVKHNPVLVEAVQRRFGVPVQVARHSEEAATGAAMLAGVHLGIWETLEDARRLVQEASA